MAKRTRKNLAMEFLCHTFLSPEKKKHISFLEGTAHLDPLLSAGFYLFDLVVSYLTAGLGA